MSTYHYAHLVYGYDLGNTEKHEIKEVGEWGSLDMPWVKRDDDGWPDESLSEALVRKLYEAIPDADPELTEMFDQDNIVEDYYGVKILEHGWINEGDTPSFALIAHEEEVDGGDAKVMDLDVLRGMVSVLKPKLSRVLEILEITPNQQQPEWLLLASR